MAVGGSYALSESKATLSLREALKKTNCSYCYQAEINLTMVTPMGGVENFGI